MPKYNPHRFEQGDTFFIDPKGDRQLDRYRGAHFMVVKRDETTVKCVDTTRRMFDLVIDEYPYHFYQVNKHRDIVGPRRIQLETENIIKE